MKKQTDKKVYSVRIANRFWQGIVVGILVFAAMVIVFRVWHPEQKITPLASSSKDLRPNPLILTTLSELLNLPEEKIENIDIAYMNLLCAEGLNGFDGMDIENALATLDKWAKIVEEDTQKRLPSYYQNPTKYNNSVNLFKVTNMILTLKQEIGVDYNQEIMKRITFLDSRDVFIHGCITGSKMGGCISIPVTCVSIGRRLGYPLKLVMTKEHVFFRWDDGKEVFNAEACCSGCDSYLDDYYMNWPQKITPAEVKNGCFLKSLTPAEELGLFLEVRGHCLYDQGKTADALVMYSYAYKLMPDSMSRLANIDQMIHQEADKRFIPIGKGVEK